LVGVGTLLAALAGSSVTVALPRIGALFQRDISTVRWVMSAFLVSVTALLMVVGRAADLVGHRRVYLLGFGLFGATSLACGLAPTFIVLVVSRVVQGIGAAMLMATGPALLTTAAPASRRGRALGTAAAATYVGLTIGPSVGGVIIANLGWRWVFFLNVPLAAALVAAGVFLLPTSKKKSARFDWQGGLILVAGLLPCLVMISEGNRWGWVVWPSGVLGAVGLALLAVFVWIEMHADSPLISLSLFRIRSLDAAIASALCNYVALFVPIILLPFYLTEGKGLAADQAGLLLSVQPAVMALVTSPAGWVSDRIGTRPLTVSGLGLMGGGLFGLATVGPHTHPGMVAVWLAVIGMGTGVFISPNSSTLMGSAPSDQQGIAGAILAVSRNLGMLIGVAAATGVFTLAGGSTGGGWQPVDFGALESSLWVAGSVAWLGGLTSFLFGKLSKD
jgi:EmrB/QacA subfamily drug resistance transporter